MEEKIQILLYLALRPRVTKIVLRSNLAHPGLVVTSFTWAYIGKTLEISLYLAIRPMAIKFCMWLYLVGLYQECLNYNPGVKIGSIPGVTSFTLPYIVGKKGKYPCA